MSALEREEVFGDSALADHKLMMMTRDFIEEFCPAIGRPCKTSRKCFRKGYVIKAWKRRKAGYKYTIYPPHCVNPLVTGSIKVEIPNHDGGVF